MANPEAVARMAGGMPQGPHKMPGGEMMGEPAGAPEAPASEPAGGLDGLVKNLGDVGEFLKAQASKGNPQAQKAMATFQSLLQDLSALGGDGASPESPMTSGDNPTPGRVHESRQPGVQVL